MPIGDLPGVNITDADRKLMEVYGDYIHQNDGTHLDGGIKDDAKWQERWRKLLVALPSQRYNAPGGSVGRRFVRMLTEEMRGIHSRKHNSEKYIVFQIVILQKSKMVTASGDIKRRIGKRMDSWEAGKFDMLVQETERTALTQLARIRGGQTQEQRAKTFSRLVLQGKLRAAVRYITEREMGGVLLPDYRDEKTGDTVLDVLQSKHPDARVPDTSVMEEYATLPDLVEIDITEEVVEKVARRLTQAVPDQGERTRLLSNNGCFVSEAPANNYVKRQLSIRVGWRTNNQNGLRTAPCDHHDAWHWTSVQVSAQWELRTPLQGSRPSVYYSFAETKQKTRAVWNNFVPAWRPELKEEYMQHASYGRHMRQRRSGDFCWWMQRMRSTKATESECVGPSDTNGRPVQDLHSIVIGIGRSSWSVQEMDKPSLFIVTRA